MAKPTSLARLKQIVAEFRSLPSRIDVRGLDLGEAQTLRLKEAGRLLIDALNLGAFNLPEHRPFVDVVLRGFGQGTEGGAWTHARQILREKAGVDYEGLLSPADLVAQFAEDCGRMADFLEKDIQRIRETTSANSESRLYSKPRTRGEWARKLNMSPTTFDRRRAKGVFRERTPREGRLIQLLVEDLPAGVDP